MNQSNQNRQLEKRMVEFEEWRQTNDSNDIELFCRERQLVPKIAESLKLLFQMEDDITKRVEAAPEAKVSDADDLHGSTIGNYQLERKLGVGGMGTVWLAHQSHPIKRKVAVKLIRPDRNSEVTARRFEREKQALALMSHMHVAKVFDAGTFLENDRPYIAMEFVDGQPITEYCISRQLSLSSRLELFLQLCSAIQHAHQNGLLHRDIKPSNVLVTEVDGCPCVKVIDFGLVRPSDGWDPEITQADMVVGSPLWMSPEQAKGYPSDASQGEAKATVDIRADIYSLGVILYELLTETTPITNEYYSNATRLELMNTIQDELPELPSTRAEKKRYDSAKDGTPVSSWASVLRNELDWVVMRALEKDRDRRYPTVVAFADDVRNYLQNEPVTARPPSFTYRLKKLTQRHKAATIAAATIFGLVTLSSIGFAWLYTVASNQTTIAENAALDARNSEAATRQAVQKALKSEKAARRSESDAHKAKAAARKSEESKDVTLVLVAELLESLDPSKNGVRATPSQLKQLNKFRNGLDKLDLSQDPHLEAKLRGFLAEVYAGFAASKSAVEQNKRIIDITSDAPDGDPRARISAMLRLALEYSNHGAQTEAIPILRTCVRESTERLGETDELSVRSEILLDKFMFKGAELKKYRKKFEANLEFAKSAFGEANETTLQAMTDLGRIYQMLGLTKEANVQFESAAKIANEMFGPNDLRTMDIKIQKLSAAGPEASMEDVDQLIEEAMTKFGPDNFIAIRLKFLSGKIAISKTKYDLAISTLEDVIKDGTEFLEPSHIMVLESKINLGIALYSKALAANGSVQRRLPASDVWFDKAEEILTSVTKTFEEMKWPQDNNSLLAWSFIAHVKLEKENPEDALNIAKHYGPIARRIYGDDAVSAQQLSAVERKCLTRLDRREEAIETAIQEYEESLALKQPPVVSANLANFVAKTSAELGQREQALKYFKIEYELRSNLAGDRAPFTLLCLLNVHNEHMNVRDFEAAEEISRKVVSGKIPAYGELLFTRSSQATLGEALCEQGKFQEAKPFLLKAAEPAKTIGILPLFEMQAKSALAFFYMEEGDRAKAIKTLTQVREQLQKTKIPAEYEWILDRCKERLDNLENH